jgi:hypothetical protein
MVGAVAHQRAVLGINFEPQVVTVGDSRRDPDRRGRPLESRR